MRLQLISPAVKDRETSCAAMVEFIHPCWGGVMDPPETSLWFVSSHGGPGNPVCGSSCTRSHAPPNKQTCPLCSSALPHPHPHTPSQSSRNGMAPAATRGWRSRLKADEWRWGSVFHSPEPDENEARRSPQPASVFQLRVRTRACTDPQVTRSQRRAAIGSRCPCRPGIGAPRAASFTRHQKKKPHFEERRLLKVGSA